MKIILILFLILLTACSPSIEKPIFDDTFFEEDTGNVKVSYDQGTLFHEVDLVIPSPCHTVKKELNIMESYPVQIVLDLILETPEEICAQVISNATIKGEMEIGHKPGAFTIKYQNETIYSTNFNIIF